MIICKKIRFPPGLKLRNLTKKVIFLFLVVVGTQLDSSFEHPKHMLKLMGKKIFRPLVKCTKNHFSYFSTKTYVVGTQKNHLNKTVHFSTQNICKTDIDG